MRSIRSFNRARTSERGFALAIAIILAVLYFGLIELLMIDASRDLAEARRFRARVVAHTLAENAAEMQARGLIGNNPAAPKPQLSDEQGEMYGTIVKSEGAFKISATGTTKGVIVTKARVELSGRIDPEQPGRPVIDWSMHPQ